jgi:hypothetical protein
MGDATHLTRLTPAPSSNPADLSHKTACRYQLTPPGMPSASRAGKGRWRDGRQRSLRWECWESS